MLRLIAFTAVVVSCMANVADVPKWSKLPIIPPPQPSAGRIVGGEETNIETVPYQVAMLFTGSLLCGGSIISINTIVSAGHCVVTSSPSVYSFRAGSSYHHSDGQVINVKTVKLHENFDGYEIDYDISLFILLTNLTIGPSSAPVNLPVQGQVVPGGAMAIVSGWGSTFEGGFVVSKIRKVNIPIVDQKDCVTAYGNIGWMVTDRMICAGNLMNGGQDACQGDSGGPLIINGELIGITSWGYGCARRGYPGVWARVPALVEWINKNL